MVNLTVTKIVVNRVKPLPCLKHFDTIPKSSGSDMELMGVTFYLVTHISKKVSVEVY